MAYLIYNLKTKEPLPERYETGEAAAEAAKALTEATGDKHQPRPAGDDGWRARERARLASGAYKPAGATLAQASAESFPDHFLHMSDKRPGMLSYTRDAANGAADRQTIVSIQAYLDAYFPSLGSEADARAALAAAGADARAALDAARADAQAALDAACADAWAALDAAAARNALRRDALDEHAALTSPGAQFKLARTPDEIEHVYTHYDKKAGPVAISCMRHHARGFAAGQNGGAHPVRVYGAGDLAVAYLTNDAGETTHRALCWPEKKSYSRMYAPDDKLHNLLRAAGYRKCGHYYGGGHTGSLAGARLLYLEDNFGNQVLPYIDGELGYGDGGVLTPDYDHEGDRTDGYAQEVDEPEEEYETSCDHCDDGCAETSEVYLNRTRTQWWCSDCVSNSAFRCEATDRNYHETRVDSRELETSETVSEYYFEDECGECAVTETYWRMTDLTRVWTGEAFELWCARAVDGAEGDGARLIRGVWVSYALSDDAAGRAPYRETSSDQMSLTLQAAE